MYKVIGGQQQQVFTKSGDQGAGWLFANITLGSLTNFSITLEVVHTLGSFKGDIAIDDIVFADCTPGAENSPASCDFEEGLCSLQHVTDNVDFNWERNSGGTGSWNTGPKADHTLNSAEGHYLYTEASYPRRQGDVAAVQTTWMSSPGPCSLTFWYHMEGEDIGTLEVELHGADGSSQTVSGELEFDLSLHSHD